MVPVRWGEGKWEGEEEWGTRWTLMVSSAQAERRNSPRASQSTLCTAVWRDVTWQ